MKDPEGFGRQMAQVVRTAVNEATTPLVKRLGELETRLAALEAHRLASAEAEVQRLRGLGS